MLCCLNSSQCLVTLTHGKSIPVAHSVSMFTWDLRSGRFGCIMVNGYTTTLIDTIASEAKVFLAFSLPMVLGS